MQIYEEISNYEINCMNLFRFMRFRRQNMPITKKSATQSFLAWQTSYGLFFSAVFTRYPVPSWHWQLS